MGLAIFIITIPFFIFALTLSKGKGASLLAGYNTLSDSEKAQYDEVALCKFMGRIMYGITFSLFLFSLGEMLKNKVIFIIGLILLLSLIFLSFVYANTGNRFKKKIE